MPASINGSQIVAVLSAAGISVWGATQWTASVLGYQARLGDAWFVLFGTPIYRPWQLFEWWYFFGAYAPGVFVRGGGIAAASGLTGWTAGILISVVRSHQTRNANTYGSACWASSKDIEKAKLAKGAGVFLGFD